MALGQNLVPNPNFEIYDTCPSGISIFGDMQIEHALGWYAPSTGTSDYYNSCNTTNVNVPNAVFGFQSAKDGNGFLGMMLLLENGELSYFEYVQAKLTKPLIQGYNYKFSFNVNLANGSDYALEKIGAWFTNNAVSSTNGQPLFTTSPQIENTLGFISDTVNWTKIEGEFMANGGEEFITIGYYSDTLNIDTLRNSVFADPTSIFSYYYIDRIELKEMESSIIIPNIITPNNDGMNDVFELNFSTESIVILNRWGQTVFISNNDNSTWNGEFNGKKVPDGTYYYVIKRKGKEYQGFVQVVR